MKQFLEDFKAFALKGNVMDMAVGVIIGGAFTGIVTSFTENIINPFLFWITGGTKFSLYSWSQISGYGTAFLSSVVNFIILAFILFCMIRAINKTLSIGKKQEEAAPTTKQCPYCKADIPIDAVKCMHCTSDVE
ncbi:MAG: large conductance mechanosensitive channel protein MscL [Lachnospiraceae bacterium]|nr:large conductance mechanosensitive channel protein MscL [Lachnospiraceae bacterium]